MGGGNTKNLAIFLTHRKKSFFEPPNGNGKIIVPSNQPAIQKKTAFSDFPQGRKTNPTDEKQTPHFKPPNKKNKPRLRRPKGHEHRKMRLETTIADKRKAQISLSNPTHRTNGISMVNTTKRDQRFGLAQLDRQCDWNFATGIPHRQTQKTKPVFQTSHRDKKTSLHFSNPHTREKHPLFRPIRRDKKQTKPRFFRPTHRWA